MSGKHETTMRQKMTHRVDDRLFDNFHRRFKQQNYYSSSSESFLNKKPIPKMITAVRKAKGTANPDSRI